MTWVEFKKHWARYDGSEAAGYQTHFTQLCQLVTGKAPIEIDPTGTDVLAFQRSVIKDSERFAFRDDSGLDPDEPERGFADVWYRGRFAFEYKRKGRNLDDAYRQLLRYRESLLNPPLLVVCDFDRFIVRTNFNGTIQETHEFTLADIDSPRAQNILRALFDNPDFLKPQRTTAQVTEELAEQIASLARSLQKRESKEYSNAKTRREVSVAKKGNLRIARFLNRIIFCLFAEDTGLLPDGTFAQITQAGLDDPHLFAESLEELFEKMAKGGRIGTKKIRRFNGHLFEEATVFELTEDELRALATAAEADWQYIEPSIMGTLFERALDDSQRSQLGAHYTSEADILTLVEPVLMAPFRREWASMQCSGGVPTAANSARATPTTPPAKHPAVGTPPLQPTKEQLRAFQQKLASTIVLDPACGSGNFLYVSLQRLLDLEKEVITHAAQLGLTLTPAVGVHQLRAIEINPYAYELAQVAVQIGYLQWRRDNGFDNDRDPVLQNLEGFENKDALLNDQFRAKPKDLKAARAEEHDEQTHLRSYYERAWPECDVIVGNPPFLGGKLLRRELGDPYVRALFEVYGKRVEPQADLCCYWFEKARELIAEGRCKRAGLLATQGIRGGANRETLKRIKASGNIFFAISDRDWILAGASVHISIIGFDDGSETSLILDGKQVLTINSDLAPLASDLTSAATLGENGGLSFMGTSKGGLFEVSDAEVMSLLDATNPTGRPNSDVVVPWTNGEDLTKRSSNHWIIDFGNGMSETDASRYEQPFERLRKLVKPERAKNNREAYQRLWWQHVEARPSMRLALAPLARFLCTARVAKYRLFVWREVPILPDSAVFAFARQDDYFFGLLQSRLHETWSLKQGTRLETRPRYTPNTCFETFPFPRPTPEQEAAIASAAKELNDLRERWLNPPEWAEVRHLEFPGTVGGPWDRYIDRSTVRDAGGFQIGTVRYPRLEPKNAESAAHLKKRTLTNLYNERPTWLALAHDKLDAAVAAAYGWPPDLTDEQILAKLLALNLERAAAEQSEPKPKKKPTRPKREDEMI